MKYDNSSSLTQMPLHYVAYDNKNLKHLKNIYSKQNDTSEQKKYEY